MIAQDSRVYLRELQTSDWKSVHHYGSDPRVIEFQAWGPHSEADSQAWVDLAVTEQTARPRKMYYFGICSNETDEIVGGVGLHLALADENRGSAEIGYSLRSDHWGKGLGIEAAKMLTWFAFDELKLHRLTAHCRTHNRPSIRLLEKLGFRREGHFLQDTWVRGTLMDSYWYARLREHS